MQFTQSTDERSSTLSPRVGLWLWRWFWRITLVISLGYAWYCFYVPKSDIAWANDYPTGKQLAVQSGKPMILFFSGEWCVPCRIMKRTVWADEQVEAMVERGFTTVLIDVGESDANSEVLKQYKVHATPTTIIVDTEENILERVQGAMTKSECLALLEKPHASKFVP